MKKTREEIFKIHTKNKPLAKDVDLKDLVKGLDGKVGSDIEFVCRKAATLAIRGFIENPKGENALTIKNRHFQEAIKLVKEQSIRA